MIVVSETDGEENVLFLPSVDGDFVRGGYRITIISGAATDGNSVDPFDIKVDDLMHRIDQIK